jgi:hypothetical protein
MAKLLSKLIAAVTRLNTGTQQRRADDDGVAYLGGPYAAIEGKVPLTL